MLEEKIDRSIKWLIDGIKFRQFKSVIIVIALPVISTWINKINKHALFGLFCMFAFFKRFQHSFLRILCLVFWSPNCFHANCFNLFCIKRENLSVFFFIEIWTIDFDVGNFEEAGVFRVILFKAIISSVNSLLKNVDLALKIQFLPWKKSLIKLSDGLIIKKTFAKNI